MFSDLHRLTEPRDRVLLALAAGALLVVALVEVGLRPGLLGVGYLALVSGPLCVIDMREHRLPNALVVPGYGFALCGALGETAGTEGLARAFGSGIALAAVLLALNLVGGLGMGDVKLGVVMGTVLGGLDVVGVAVSFVAAFLLGGIYALVMLARGVRSAVAFGPFLLLGFWASIVFVG